jgi:hypothetical protein
MSADVTAACAYWYIFCPLVDIAMGGHISPIRIHFATSEAARKRTAGANASHPGQDI